MKPFIVYGTGIALFRDPDDGMLGRHRVLIFQAMTLQAGRIWVCPHPHEAIGPAKVCLRLHLHGLG